MTSKLPRSLRHWEITREKGMWKFILQTGLGWGAFMFVLNLLMATPLRYSILVTACIWLMGGLILAFFVWVVSERRYRRYVGHEVNAHEA
jgi:hypothetical protein